MSEDETPVAEDEIPVDDSEASEAEGVAEIEREARGLRPEDVEALDRETLEGLEARERAEIKEAAARLRAAGAPASASVQLSASFVLAEFHCCNGHCAGAFVPSAAVPALRRLVTQVLQPMRDRFGRCTVNSGFRNERHNRHVGGVADSRHRYDANSGTPAADVTFARGNVDQWAAEARRLLPSNLGGIGRYRQQRFVHVDLGPKRRWDG